MNLVFQIYNTLNTHHVNVFSNISYKQSKEMLNTMLVILPLETRLVNWKYIFQTNI